MKFMKMAISVAFGFVALSSFAATIVAPSKSELATHYEKATQELAANHYEAALEELDAIEARQPGLADVQNFRGVISMQRGEYKQAEAVFRKALEIDPTFLQASFNLADLAFVKKEWAEAREQFGILLKSVPDELRETIVPLIEYKILLTVLFANNEEKIGELLSKLKSYSGSPAFAYSEAAIAFHRQKEREGREWLADAEKAFPAQENRLFLESFYEVGWLSRPAGESRPVTVFDSPGQRAARMTAEAQANFEQAQRAFEARDFSRAEQFLDRAGEGAPNQAAFWNLRAEIFMEQKKFGEAEAASRRAMSADPISWEAKEILARISFRKKNYAESRTRLEALLNEMSNDLKNENGQLIRYQIFLDLLLEGKESAAQQRMEQFRFTDATPALYYAQAAWSFRHHNPEQANQWVVSAGKLFSPALNAAFAKSLADLGWFNAQSKGPEEETKAASTTADVSSSPSPAPTLRSRSANPPPVPVVAENRNTPTPAVVLNEATAPTANSPSRDSVPAASASPSSNSLGETKQPPSVESHVAKSQPSPASAVRTSPPRASIPPTPSPTPTLRLSSASASRVPLATGNQTTPSPAVAPVVVPAPTPHARPHEFAPAASASPSKDSLAETQPPHHAELPIATPPPLPTAGIRAEERPSISPARSHTTALRPSLANAFPVPVSAGNQTTPPPVVVPVAPGPAPHVSSHEFPPAASASLGKDSLAAAKQPHLVESPVARPRPLLTAKAATAERDSTPPIPSPAPTLRPSPANSSTPPIVTRSHVTPTPRVQPQATPAPARDASPSSPAPASERAEKEKLSRSARDSLGRAKAKRSHQRAKPAVAKSQVAPTAKIEPPHIAPLTSAAAFPTLAPLPPVASAPAPRPPFFERLARTLRANGEIKRRPVRTWVPPTTLNERTTDMPFFERRQPQN